MVPCFSSLLCKNGVVLKNMPEIRILRDNNIRSNVLYVHREGVISERMEKKIPLILVVRLYRCFRFTVYCEIESLWTKIGLIL